jgi:hypothetical protein
MTEFNRKIGHDVVDGMFAIAQALEKVAGALDRLGTADAATPMGAIEMLACEVRDGLGAIAISIDGHGES